MATERSGWNDCLLLAAQLKQQSLTNQQSPTNMRERSTSATSPAQALEKLRQYQLEMQNRVHV